MELLHLRAVCAIADNGSITAAARQLFLTPVSLMQQLNALETELGFPVFNRTHQGCTLTPAGEHFYKGAQDILKQTRSLIASSKNIASESDTTIHIGIYKPLDFMSITEAYRQIHPEISFQYSLWQPVEPLKMSEWMQEQHIDILQQTWIPEFEAQGLCCQNYKHDRYCAYFTHDSPLSSLSRITLDALTGIKVYSYSELSNVVGDLERKISAANISFQKVPFSESNVLSVCSSGGVFLLEESLNVLFAHLCCVPLYPLVHCTHTLLYFKNPRSSIQAFLNHIQRQFDESGRKQPLE